MISCCNGPTCPFSMQLYPNTTTLPCGQQVQAANSAADRSTAAQQLLQQRMVTADSAAISSMWRQFRKCDREASGKLSCSEFAAALQNSKLGLSSADVLQVANGLADSNGLLDYRPVGHLLRSQASADLTPPKVAGADVGSKKPPLPRAGCSVAAARKSCGSDQTAKQDKHAADATTAMSSLTAAASLQPQPQFVSGAVSSGEQGLPRPMQSDTEAHSAAQADASAAASQQISSRDARDAGRAGTSASPGSMRPGTAPVQRATGPPAQKVPYFFSKGQIDIQQPYQWKPSRDNTTVRDVAVKSGYERPWTAMPARSKPSQVSLQANQRQSPLDMTDMFANAKQAVPPIRNHVSFEPRITSVCQAYRVRPPGAKVISQGDLLKGPSEKDSSVKHQGRSSILLPGDQ